MSIRQMDKKGIQLRDATEEVYLYRFTAGSNSNNVLQDICQLLVQIKIWSVNNNNIISQNINKFNLDSNPGHV